MGRATGAIDGSQSYNAFNDEFGSGAWITAGDYEDNTAPKAFLNYLLFDQNFELVDAGFDQVTQAGATAHDYLSLHVKVEKAGYLYIYLSNEGAVIQDVYFDDFKIVHNTRVEQVDDYYPFGLAFNSYSRENSVPQNFKFNGIEQQNDLNLGVYSAFYRMYDPAIGRWWQIDPKPSLQESLYLGMDGNPVLRPDPLGDKVRYERGEGVSREQHREFKREIRQMRRDSDSFGKMHKDLRKDKSTFVYKSESKSVSSSGAYGKTEQKDGKTYMSVNVNSSAEGSKSATQISGIAHETGHGWRQIQGLDGPEPTLTGTDRASMNSYIDAFAQHHEASERGATHIENIVKSELMLSGNSSYDGISLRSEYSPGFKSVMSFDANMQMQKTLKVTTYNVLKPPRDANYYNRTIDIHQEHGVQPIE